MPQASSTAAIGLQDVLITGELSKRLPAELDRAAADAALHDLGSSIASGHLVLVRQLVEAALRLCSAHTSGISILRTDADGVSRFHWDALAGVYAGNVGGTTPRDFSPCGATLDRRSPQLFHYPGRLFTYFQAAEPPPIVEGLVLPIYVDHLEYGTLWVVSHDQERHFTSAETQIMQSLCSFAGAAVSLLKRRAAEAASVA